MNPKKLLIHLVAAARPNFMKIAPLYHALKKEEWAVPVIVHTGQHYDLNMSEAFFEDLSLPKPGLHLGVGSGTHAEQTGQVMMAYEKVLMEQKPDLIVVAGDVNSTLACTLAASKIVYPKISNKGRVTNNENPASSTQHLEPRTQNLEPRTQNRPLVAHLEAGLRSFDRTMPEEINRLVTDALADILWTPSPDADENLISEGVSPAKIHRIGNIMIDSLEMLRDKIEAANAYEEYGLMPGNYGLLTLHRPSNVDSQEVLKSICQSLKSIAQKIPLIFPIHPRTRKNLSQNGLMTSLNESPGICVTAPLNYIHFMNLLLNCHLAITDSGGIQEETTYLDIPCLTLRPNTERPITIKQGTNQLVRPEDLKQQVDNILSNETIRGRVPEFWDGQTATRAVQSIRNLFRENINEHLSPKTSSVF